MGIGTCLICLPFVLCYYSIKIYFAPCLRYYLYKLCCCIYLCRQCLLFDDDDFNDVALGELFEKHRNNIEWKRCYDNAGCKFISNHIHPNDVIQGNIGNCWLMSALSCMAEHEGALHNLFDNRDMSMIGKYTVNLYNKNEKKWVKITVDDKIPYMKSSGSPLFANSCDKEIWVMILEKAFAKFVGNYSKLQGGSIAWALEALSGDCVMKFSHIDREWQKSRMTNINREVNPRSVMFMTIKEKYDSIQMFEIFKEYDKQSSVLSAYIANDSEWKRTNGLVAGHAYSIIRVEEIWDHKLLQLRNPWGKFEWNGDWSDKSELWKKHTYIAFRLGHEIKDDGVFWINWYDFQSLFTDVDVCHRTTGVKDLVLDIHEDLICGTTIGCVKGCGSFWCCCQGCKAIYCPNNSNKDTLKVKKTCIIL